MTDRTAEIIKRRNKDYSVGFEDGKKFVAAEQRVIMNNFEMAIEEEENGVRIHWKDKQWFLPGLQTEQIGDVSTVDDVLSINMKFGSTIKFRADGFVKWE